MLPPHKPLSKTALIAKIRAAEDGSRELDLEIARTMQNCSWRWLDKPGGDVTYDKYGEGAAGNPVCGLEPFTISIEAALVLVPPGAEFTITTLYGIAMVEMPLNFVDTPSQVVSRKDGNIPLAICECAIKATPEIVAEVLDPL